MRMINLNPMQHMQLLMVVLLGVSLQGYSENHIQSVSINKLENRIIVAPQLDFETSVDIKEAIDNGIRIQLIVKAQIFEPVSWWFDDTLENKKINLEVSYFILGKLYVVKNKDTSEQLGFNNYKQLWKEFEKLMQFEFNRPKNNKTRVKIRIMLDKGALPTAMQLPVLFNDQWDINTQWHEQSVIINE